MHLINDTIFSIFSFGTQVVFQVRILVRLPDNWPYAADGMSSWPRKMYRCLHAGWRRSTVEPFSTSSNKPIGSGSTCRRDHARSAPGRRMLASGKSSSTESPSIARDQIKVQGMHLRCLHAMSPRVLAVCSRESGGRRLPLRITRFCALQPYAALFGVADEDGMRA